MPVSLAFFIISLLPAQEIINDTDPNKGIIPLTLILEKAEFAAGRGRGERTLWQPDWPADLPPDAFMVNYGELSRVTLIGDAFSLEYKTGEDNCLLSFPMMLGGKFASVSFIYGLNPEIKEMEVMFEGDEPLKLDFLERFFLNNFYDYFPVVIRGSKAGSWFFIYLSGGGNEILESWYDEAGNFLGAFGYTTADIGAERRIVSIRENADPDPEMSTLRYFDSRGFITESSGPGGVFKAHFYKDDLPRYWERRPVEKSSEWTGDGTAAGTPDSPVPGAGKFTFQWDDGNFLVRMTGASDDAGQTILDNRYEYSLDEKGNWTERREVRMFRSGDLLVPGPGTSYKRVLEYRLP